MREGTYRIAGHAVRIFSLHEDVHILCDGYKTESEPEIWIRIEENDITKERKRAQRTDEKEGRLPGEYPDGYLETLAVYRKLTEQLLHYGILLMHGSVVAVDGEGYLFTAKSGTGKSTHTALWMKQFGERAMMINDDKPLLEITKDGLWVYGTPWDGKHHRSTNTKVPLKAICAVNRSEQNEIRKAEPRELYPLLLQQIHRQETVLGLQQTLELLECLWKQAGLYQLYCNMEPEAALVAYEGMREKEGEKI